MLLIGNGQYGAELMIDFARSNAIKPEERAKFTKEMHDLFEPLRNAPLKDVDVGFILQSGTLTPPYELIPRQF